MSRKALILVISVTALSLAIPHAGIRRDRAVDAGTMSGAAKRTYTVTVEVESLRVISYLDDDGVEHPADSTLVPPVPEWGPREITVVVDRGPDSSAPLAGRVGPR